MGVSGGPFLPPSTLPLWVHALPPSAQLGAFQAPSQVPPLVVWSPSSLWETPQVWGTWKRPATRRRLLCMALHPTETTFSPVTHDPMTWCTQQELQGEILGAWCYKNGAIRKEIKRRVQGCAWMLLIRKIGLLAAPNVSLFPPKSAPTPG